MAVIEVAAASEGQLLSKAIETQDGQTPDPQRRYCHSCWYPELRLLILLTPKWLMESYPPTSSQHRHCSLTLTQEGLHRR
eukprot:scaffold4049_cov204-Alexandrium_tamarense.AAC.60